MNVKGEYSISRQLIRSGTAIGAIIREAEHAESIRDFIHKLCMSLKEANESKYWLDLLAAPGFISMKMFDSLNKDCEELLKLILPA
jgi:four helix bundle protein